MENQIAASAHTSHPIVDRLNRDAARFNQQMSELDHGMVELEEKIREIDAQREKILREKATLEILRSYLNEALATPTASAETKKPGDGQPRLGGKFVKASAQLPNG